VAGVADLDLAAVTDPAANHRREIRQGCAVAENPVGPCEQFAGRLRGRGQATKNSVKLSHEHRCCHTFPCHVTNKEAGAVLARDPVALIAADRTGRLVVVRYCPTVRDQLSFGKESLLNLKGQIQIALQSALLGRRQMVDTVPTERIDQQSIILNRIMASFADAEGAGLHSLQCGVHFTEQLPNTIRMGNGADGSMKPFSSGQKLLAQGGISDGVDSLARLYFKLIHGLTPVSRFNLLNVSIYSRNWSVK